MPGNDSYTQLLLHMDESPLVDSSSYSRSLTLTNAVRSATQSKFGGYSCFFPRTAPDPGRKIQVAANSAFNIRDYTYYTIDFWFNKTGGGGGGWQMMGQGTPTSHNYWAITYNTSYGVYLEA